MKKNIKYIIWGFAALAVIGGIVSSILAPAAVPLTSVELKTAELSFTEQGLYKADSVMRIYSEVQGKPVEISAKEGQPVSKGDLLCVIDSGALEQRLAQAKSSIRGYEAQARSTSAATDGRVQLQNILIDENQRNLDRALEDLERNEALYQVGAVSKLDYDNALSNVKLLESTLEASKYELTVIKADAAEYYQAMIEAESINITQLERDIENCRIISPFDGVVTMLYIKDTNLIMANSLIAEITSDKDGEIEVFISTSDVNSVKAGDTVSLTLKRREGDFVFSGLVESVDVNAEVRLSALGVEERKVKARILPDPAAANAAQLGDGFSVDVKFIIYSAQNKLTVPKTALFKRDNKDMLWVVRGGKAQAIEVVKGMELRTEFVIESGLIAGDRVVTDANNDALKDGLRVKAD